MTSPFVIDAHHHVWDLTVRDQDWITGPELTPLRRNFTLAALRSLAARAGVQGTVVVQTVPVAEETPEMLAMTVSDPLVVGVVGWTDLTSPDVAETLAELRERPGGENLAGVRHQVQSEPDPRWLVRDDVLRGLAAVADAGLAYDLLIRPHQLPSAVEAAQRLPHLRFVLDHAGKPAVRAGELEPWASGLRTLAAEPNTFCKLSGLVTEADWAGWRVDDLLPYARTVLDAFGPDRVMYGSDWPVCTLAAQYAEVMETAVALAEGFSQHDRTALFGGTAERAYRLHLSRAATTVAETQ